MLSVYWFALRFDMYMLRFVLVWVWLWVRLDLFGRGFGALLFTSLGFFALIVFITVFAEVFSIICYYFDLL